MKLGTAQYEVLSTPERVRVPRINTSGDPAKDDKVSIRVQLSQLNIETGEVSQGDYGFKNYELLMQKRIGQKFSVKREKSVNDFYIVTAY